MRTTVDIDDDVLLAVREIARQRGLSTGKVLADLAREALTHRAAGQVPDGIPQFPTTEDSRIASLEMVNRLRDEMP